LSLALLFGKFGAHGFVFCTQLLRFGAELFRAESRIVEESVGIFELSLQLI
jgi:hypothetical protein